MIKRFVWWASGAVMGAGGSLWAQRKVKRAMKAQAERIQAAMRPANLALVAKDRMVDAVQNGKVVVLDRERELRGRVIDAGSSAASKARKALPRQASR